MKNLLDVKDHSVSGESFRLRYDASLHMFYTEPKPSEKELPGYYKSEDYISHTDSKRSLFEMAYQVVKRITLSRKQKLLRFHLPNRGHLLDIGAGTGDFLSYAAKKGWTVSGVEPNEQARQLALHKKVKLASGLPDKNERYDAITMWHVLEHVYDLEPQLQWLKKRLTTNGVLFVAVPNFESYDAQHYKNDWAAYDVPRHLYHFSRMAIAGLFEKYDMKVVDTVPMKFDAYYVSLLSEKYASGAMNFLRAFITGYTSNRKAKKSGAYSSLIYVLKHA